MEVAKDFELRAEYKPETKTVLLALWKVAARAGDDPVDTAEVALCKGYHVALRMARRSMLERAGVHASQVLGA